LEASTTKLNEAAQSLAKSLVPKHPFADLPCIMEIRPGVGGQEATLFARELFNMYNGYCVENRLQPSVIKADDSKDDTHGLTEGILQVEKPGSYGILRGEAGVHRVQRVPATEVKGRTHTSTVSVMILPMLSQNSEEIEDINDPESDFYINTKDVRTDYLRSSGAGGQHVNRTESAVRLVYNPMNIVVLCQTQRNRNQNEVEAWKLLRAKIAHARREAREEKIREMRRSVVGVAKIGRSDKVRTYNFQQQRVTDHRTGCTVHGMDGVMQGGENLEKVMQSVQKWLAQMELEDAIVDAEEQDTELDVPPR
jgi:peptide chain release factor 1